MKRKRIPILISMLALMTVTASLAFAEVGDRVFGYYFLADTSGYKIVSPTNVTVQSTTLNDSLYKFTLGEVVKKMKDTNAIEVHTTGTGYDLDINVGLSGTNIDFWTLDTITEDTITSALVTTIDPDELTAADTMSLTYEDQVADTEGFEAKKSVISASKPYDLNFTFRVPANTNLVNVAIPTLWYESYTTVDTGRKVNHPDIDIVTGISTDHFYPVYKVVYKYEAIAANKVYFNSMLKGVTKAKETILTAIAVGSIEGSVSIYNVYSAEATPLGDPKEGVPSGLLTMKAGSRYFSDLQKNNGATNLKFSLDSFLNPSFGILAYNEIPTTVAGWKAFSTRVKVITEGSTGSINIVPHSTFLEYVKSDTVIKNAIRSLDGVVLKTTNADTFVNLTENGHTLVPSQMVSYMMRVGVPSIFIKKDTNKYGLLLTDGQSSSGEAVYGVDIMEDLYIGVHDMRFYKKHTESTGGYTFEDVGSIADYGDISPYKLALYQSVDPTDPKKLVGTVLQLVVREAVYHNDALLVTGRDVEWGGTYSAALELNTENESVFKASTVNMGDKALKPIDFAFRVGSDYTKVPDHTPFSTDTPNEIMYHYTFIDGTGADTNNKKGIVMVRNNAYLNNTDLKEWLESSEITGFLTTDEAASIITLMKGIFDLDSAPLTYKELARFKEIKMSLENIKKDSLLGIIRIASLVMGVLLVVYATFLVLFYWFDILNPFTNFQVLSFATGGKLYAVSGKDYADYVAISEDKTYVGVFKMAQIWVLSVLLGAVFINLQIILGIIIYLYNTINNLF